MARKTGHYRATRKSSKPMRAVARSVDIEPTPRSGAAEDLDGLERESAAPASKFRKPAVPRSHTGQHRKASAAARVTASPFPTITRDQEYAFIREDLRRLLITAAILIFVMIGLLLVINQ